MPRNDGILYSGSAGNREIAEKEKKRSEERYEQRRLLSPVADIIHQEFEKQREINRQRLIDIVSPDTTDEKLQQVLFAIRLNEQDLKAVESRINNMLRLSKAEQEALKREARNV